MSLLEDFARPCVRLVAVRELDGEGGWITKWTEGASFRLALALDTQAEARLAEKQGVASLYTALAGIDAPIAFGDYFRDTSTGLTYRVTSCPEEKQSPGSATFRLKYFTAEREVPPA